MKPDVERVLADHGAKVTRQRLALAEILFSRPQHLSAEGLLDAALAARVHVSKATVYNTLNLFAECGLVREVNVDSSRVYYDSTTRPHHHFFNVDTGQLEDLPDDAVSFLRMPDLPEGTEAAGLELVVKIRNRRD